jgi:tRNA 5-methylaminomethyl-2-thiouridine biosynthesis bifunctional protein
MTQNPSHDPQAYFGEDGAPRSARFGDIYYSLEDGLEETRHVFFKGCGLPEAWSGRQRFCVAELGFGTGLNIAALLELWSQTRAPAAQLQVFTIEGFLMPREDAVRALSAFPALAEFAEAILAQWPKERRGFHYMDFPQWGVHLTLALLPVEEALVAWQGRADAWFLDGFSPALNPDMWSEGVITAIAGHSAVGARLATFTAASAVRRALTAAGFAVEKRPGYGRKRERLVARWPDGEVEAPRLGPVAIIGAGIAGACIAHHARHLGLEVTVFDAEGIGAGASGNPGGLMTPRLDAGAADITALFADAACYAFGFYHRLAPEAVTATGVDLMASKPKDAGRFATISQQTDYAPGDLTLDATGQVLRIGPALTLKPRLILEALLAGLPVRAAHIRRVEGQAGDYRLIDAEGIAHGPFATVCLCLGQGVLDWPEIPDAFGLKAVRGQMEYVAGEGPQRALSWGGYYAPLKDGFAFGATHERDDRQTDVRERDCVANLDSLSEVLPDLAGQIAPQALVSRASIRIMSRDYLPLCGELQPGLHLLTGLGSRGFCLAPLLGNALALGLSGAASPVRAQGQKCASPARLIGRRLR